METLNQIVAVIPEKYRGFILMLIAVSPLITRAYHALATGGGIKGVLSAIWLGTNTNKQLAADVAEVKEAVRTGNTEFLTKK